VDMGAGNQRNMECYCGSGKKQKKCCQNKKPREANVLVDMGKKVIINKLRLDSNGQVSFLKDDTDEIPQKAKLILSHPKDNNKGTKQIFNVPQIPTDIRLDLSSILLYDYVFFIDTNTTKDKVDPDNFLSCTAMQAYKIKDQDLIGIDEKSKIFFHTEKLLAEKIAIIELLKILEDVNGVKMSITTKVMIITDHDLGNIEKYNSRELPLLENPKVYLPPNITLAYASADKKNDSFLNVIINQCDQTAKKNLREALTSLPQNKIV